MGVVAARSPGVDPQSAHDVAVWASAAGAVAAEDRIAACTRAINWGEWRDKAVEWAYVDRCAAESGRGANDDAVSDCTDAIRLNPTDAVAFNDRESLASQGRRKGTRHRRLRRGDKARPEARRRLSQSCDAWAAQGDREKAIADYDEAIRLAPTAVAFINRGNAWLGIGDNDRAIADYDKAIRLDPKDAVAFIYRASAWRAKGINDRVIADYDEAIRLDPKSARAYLSRGVALITEGSLAAARADFAQANALDPKYVYAALWLDVAERRNRLPSRFPEHGEARYGGLAGPDCPPSHGRDRSCGAPRRRR